MNWVRGVDASFTHLSRVEGQRLAAQGTKVWVQCLWTATQRPEHAQHNLGIARLSGLVPCGYFSINGSRPGAEHVEEGRATVDNDTWDAMPMVFVDVEVPGIRTVHVQGALEALAERDKRAGIYTTRGFWMQHMGDTKDFSSVPLWNAFWDQHPDVDFARYPYGGWDIKNVVGEQWSGGTEIPLPPGTDGVFVDRDTFDLDLLKPRHEPPVLGELGMLRAKSAIIDALSDGDWTGIANVLRYIGRL